MLALRDYQRDCLEAIQAHLRYQSDAPLLVAPTGSGKTIIFAALARQAVANGQRVFILVHRKELLEQVSRALTQLEVPHGCISPDYPDRKTRPVQVASVLTLVRRLAEHRCPDLIIIDEAHHAIGPSTWGRILTQYRASAYVGVTATPERLGGEGLDTFGTILYAPTTKSLIDAGHLSPYRLFRPPPPRAITGVHRRMGDYDKGELAQAMDTPTITGDAIEHYLRLAKGKRAIVFCVRVSHAVSTAEKFQAAGIPAASIDGTLDRVTLAARIAAFREGSLLVLTSCDLVSEGFDLPAIEVAILLRPTHSLALFLQQVGRALRPFPGKAYALILDHAGNTERHGLPDDEREWSLSGKGTREQQEREHAVDVRTCGQCFMAVRAPASVCPSCGYVWPVVSREVETVAGDLVEIDLTAARQAKKQEQGQARTLGELQDLGKRLGHKTEWAWHIFHARKRKQANYA